MSDGLVKVGPLSLGFGRRVELDSRPRRALQHRRRAAFLILQGLRAGVPMPVLASAVAMLSLRTVASAVPIAGAAFADMFTAHKWTANMIMRAIDKQLGEPVSPRPAPGYPSWRGRTASV